MFTNQGWALAPAETWNFSGNIRETGIVQGLKAAFSGIFSARLKSCPVTRLFSRESCIPEFAAPGIRSNTIALFPDVFAGTFFTRPA
jgi:hypothetical protein